jgi:hypothetical protein
VENHNEQRADRREALTVLDAATPVGSSAGTPVASSARGRPAPSAQQPTRKALLKPWGRLVLGVR